MVREYEALNTVEDLRSFYQSKWKRDPPLPRPGMEEAWVSYMRLYLHNSANSMGWAHNVCSLMRRMYGLCSDTGGALPASASELESVMCALLLETPAGSRLVCGDGVLLGLIATGLLEVMPAPHFNGALGMKLHQTSRTVRRGILRRKHIVEDTKAHLVLVEYVSQTMLSTGIGESVPEDCLWVYPPSQGQATEPDSWEEPERLRSFQILPIEVQQLSEDKQEVYKTLRSDGMQGTEALEMARVL